MARQQRNYQDKIFTEYTVEEVVYITADTANGIEEKKCLVYTPKGDTLMRRAWQMILHGGGGNMYDMEQWAIDATNVGYVSLVPTYKEAEDDADLKGQINSIINIGALSRFAHVNKARFGINGAHGFCHGTSYGGMTSLQYGMVMNSFSDPLFASPINDQNKKAKQTILATGSHPGSASKTFTDFLKVGGVPNFGWHGVDDPKFPIRAIRNVTKQMNDLGISSTLHEYPSPTAHVLNKFHDEIREEMFKQFAGEMGIAPVVVA